RPWRHSTTVAVIHWRRFGYGPRWQSGCRRQLTVARRPTASRPGIEILKPYVLLPYGLIRGLSFLIAAFTILQFKLALEQPAGVIGHPPEPLFVGLLLLLVEGRIGQRTILLGLARLIWRSGLGRLHILRLGFRLGVCAGLLVRL